MLSRIHLSWAKVGASLKVFGVAFAKVAIIIFLIDGFLDITYSGADYLRQWLKMQPSVRLATVKRGSANDFVRDWPQSRWRDLPGIGDVLQPLKSKSVNIDANGMRSNGAASPQHPHASGLLLGASQAFGYRVGDDMTMSAELEKQLPGVRVENYAGIGERMSKSVLRWRYLIEQGKKPDFVIIAGGSYDLLQDCLTKNALEMQTAVPRVYFLYDRIVGKLKNNAAPSTCDQSHELDKAVEHSANTIAAAVAFGRKQGGRFAIVLLPAPFDVGMNTSKFESIPEFRRLKRALQKGLVMLRERLRKLNMPEVIDVSARWNSSEPAFVDHMGHLSGNANKRVAEILIDELGDRFFEAKRSEEQQKVHFGKKR